MEDSGCWPVIVLMIELSTGLLLFDLGIQGMENKTLAALARKA